MPKVLEKLRKGLQLNMPVVAVCLLLQQKGTGKGEMGGPQRGIRAGQKGKDIYAVEHRYMEKAFRYGLERGLAGDCNLLGWWAGAAEGGLT